RIDPRWRLEEIEADRAEVPEEVNGALHILAARREMPERWRPPFIDPDWNLLPDPQRLRDDTVAEYPGERDRYPQALALARRMTRFERGCYALTITPDPYSTRLPRLDALREVGWLLATDSVLLSHDGDASAALRSCLALMNVATSVGDEP